MMSGVDECVLALAAGTIGMTKSVAKGMLFVTGGALLLTGGAFYLLYRGVKAATGGSNRAAERAKAENRAAALSRERAAATERAIQAMRGETQKAEQRIKDAGLLFNSQIQTLHEEITRMEEQQDARLAKHAQGYNAFLERLAQNSAARQDRLAVQARDGKEEIEEQAILTAAKIDEMRTGILREMASQREALEQDMERLRIDFENETREVSEAVALATSRLDTSGRTTEEHQKIAQYWIEQAGSLVAGMETVRRDESAQAALDKLRRELDNAKQSMRNLAYEAAIVSGRMAFTAAFELKERIFSKENERNQLYALWRNQQVKISEDIKDNEHLVYEMETSEGVEKIPSDLDYWTSGKFKVLRDAFKALEARMADVEKLPAEALRQGIFALEKIGAELAVIQQTGKANFVLSHNRYVQGCHFADVLGENFAMTDCEGDYEGGEQRDSYVGIYKNPATKDTIVVKIQPVADESGIMNQNRLELHYFNKNNNEEQREEWRRKITEELGGQKLICKSCKNLPSNQAQMADIDWIRQQKQQQAY
jgi:hypothetical protein